MGSISVEQEKYQPGQKVCGDTGVTDKTNTELMEWQKGRMDGVKLER